MSFKKIKNMLKQSLWVFFVLFGLLGIFLMGTMLGMTLDVDGACRDYYTEDEFSVLKK